MQRKQAGLPGAAGKSRPQSRLDLAARLIADGTLPAKPALLDGPQGIAAGRPSGERLRGMMLGLAIGDALGNTSESLEPAVRRAREGEIRDYLPNPHLQDYARAGLPSDDTQLAFWTLESMLERDGLDPEDLSGRFASRRIFGVGRTVGQFLANREAGGEPWYRYGAERAGNGALMRIAPVVFPHAAGEARELWVDAALATIVTHRDAAAVASSVGFVDVLRRAFALKRPPEPDWWLDTFLDAARRVADPVPYEPRGGIFKQARRPFVDYVEHVVREGVREGWATERACNSWYSGAYLPETMPSVLYILMRHGHDPEEAIVRAVNDTRDNDTIAAIVGAAVGALHGAPALPRRWIDGLLGRTQSDDDGRVFELVDAALVRWG